jgi:hypothetical protein
LWKKEDRKLTRQLHVDLTREQLRKFKAAVKVLGHFTMSAYIRQKIFEAIREAEEIKGVL